MAKKVNPLKYFNDQADKRKKTLSKAALGMNIGDPPYGKPEYWAAGDSTNIKNALVNKLNVRNKLEKDAGYFTNTEEQLKKAIADRDKYVAEKEAYMKAINITPSEWGNFSPMIQPKAQKLLKKKKRSHFD